MLSRMIPTPTDIIGSYMQDSASVAEESITEREDMVIDVPQEDIVNDAERQRMSQWNSMTSVELVRTESRPRDGDEFGGDAMEHMREIMEFAQGDNQDEVGAIMNDEERSIAEWNDAIRRIETRTYWDDEPEYSEEDLKYSDIWKTFGPRCEGTEKILSRKGRSLKISAKYLVV